MSNILFFSPPFFNYPTIIKSGLTKIFDKVTYFNTVPSSKLFKAFWYIEAYLSISVFKKRLENKLFQTIQHTIEYEGVEYDYIFAVKGSCIPDCFYKYLKQRYPNAKYIQYLWDDISNDPNALNTFKYYDRILSYNEKDCVKYNLLFRPFFYAEEFLSNEKDRKYDISCIMSFSEDRIIFLNKFFTACSEINNKFILIKASRLLKLMYHSKIANLKNYISPNGLSYSEMMIILQQSKCQVDIQHPKPEGLTTRAFEAIATRTKLVTTNPNIKEYDFYDPDNIMVVSRDYPLLDLKWLNKPYKLVPAEIMDRYTLTSFINDIIYE